VYHRTKSVVPPRLRAGLVVDVSEGQRRMRYDEWYIPLQTVAVLRGRQGDVPPVRAVPRGSL